jgi:KUP system potassium uptake protein
LLSVSILDVPSVSGEQEIEVHRLPHGFYRVIARFGFMQTPDVFQALQAARRHGLDWNEEDTTFYLAHLTLFANDRIGMSIWRDKLFIFLSRNARRATNFFQIPADRVVEIGIQLEM